MTPEVQIAIIAAVPPTVVALGAVLLGWMNRAKLENVGQKVDGRLTELLDLTRKSSHAEGVAEQKEKTD
jgi:hypothetical protein